MTNELQQHSPEDDTFNKIRQSLIDLLEYLQQKEQSDPQEISKEIDLVRLKISEPEFTDSSNPIELLIKSLLALGATREDIAAAIAGE